MRSAPLIAALKRSFRASSDQELRRMLGMSAVTLGNWKRKKRVTPQIVAATIKRVAKRQIAGEEVVNAAKRKLRAATLTDLAANLGVTNQAIRNWKNGRVVTARQIAGLLATARVAAEKSTHTQSIRPLVEFFPIIKAPSQQGAKFEIFSDVVPGRKKHPYLTGLKEELRLHHGVYIFFDSRGSAIYAGKARKQKLWRELKNAFNRKREDLQKIRGVKHPGRKQKYRTTNEKQRQIKERSVPLHEIAYYFSAYEVADGMIDVVESLLVRSFANDLLNKRMERFGRS